MTMISPTTSLSSSDSCVSSCSEFSVDVSSYRANQEENTSVCQENLSCRPNGRLQNSSFEHQVNGLDRSQKVMENNLKESSSCSDGYTVRDVEIIETSNDQEAKDNVATNSSSFSDGIENSDSLEDETDAQIWELPEPNDPEDDMEGSVAFNDDDDEECGDGMKWGRPSSLSNSRDEGSGSDRFKEEKQRATEAVINGKFKTLVCQLLKSVGLASSGEDGESWVDVIASLSWEAASFLKPDAVVGKAMDPDGYVKVKCIATGVRSQSQLVKGLVFKKHAAHKHMPTKYKNPRLLLIKGVLGQSSSGLSSFDSMEQEQGYLKFVIEMLDLCHPNVILVEKTVSRDIQESILAKGMTLVFDMKLHRLERVARCTGSPILSSDTMTSKKLKQCDSFHIEKFTEEHAGFGGGKVPSKTLMFIEGCPTRLGCTILLKGAQSDELKKIKCVVQCAVILAYHLKLETAFLVDQRAMFSTLPFSSAANVLSTEVANGLPTDKISLNFGPVTSCVSQHRDTSAETGSDAVDILISNGFHEGCYHNFNLECEGNSTCEVHEPYNPAIFSGFSSLSASLSKVIGGSFPLASSYQSLSSYFGFNAREPNGEITRSVSVSTSPEAIDLCDVEDKGSSDEERSLNGQTHTSFTCTEASPEMKEDGGNSEDQMQSKKDISTVLDSQSILVLMSSQNALRGTVCEQRHFSHIMFYKNFDVPIGKFLQDNLLTQRSQCNCGDLPDAHFYYYAHHNKQLTIRVKRLPGEERLPGEAYGKLWMWSRCGKCKSRNGVSKCTKRVLISTAARGPMVAMFKYSLVTTYTVSVPPLKLPFSNSIRQGWLMKETQNVYMKVMLLFTEVANTLKKIRSQFDGLTLKLRGSFKEFSDIEDMLKQECSEFEVSIQNAVRKNGNSDQAAYKLLSLNRVLWELILESCVWDRRLHSLLSPDSLMIHSGASEKVVQEKVNSDIDGIASGGIVEKGEKCIDGGASLKVKLDTASEADESPSKDILVGGPVRESKGADPFYVSNMAEDFETSNVGGSSRKRLSSQGSNLSTNGSTKGHSENNQLEVDRTFPISTENGDCSSIVDSNLSLKGTSHHSLSSNLENSNDWFWVPFSEIRQIGMKDLHRVYLPKFESLSSYTAEYLPTAHQLIREEGQMLHIPLGTDNHIVSDYEGELSSMIACALALLKDLPLQTEVLADGSKGESGIASRKFENLHGLTRIPTITSSHWSSNGSSDSDSVHSNASISLDESRFSSFDGLNLLDSLVPPGTVNPVVPLGGSKSHGKDKYTVICPYANQFRDLRNRCCQSEVDYIASLSRCRNWDAKGGKSKSFFAKTLDDRLIIKEIKKTEFESFIKFAEDYFKYVNESFDNGNQTCLAKVLGIYQVVLKQTKSGKEMRHDLMVMENLTFGRNIIRQYDLKGALHARFNSAADGSGDVLLDQNFVNDMNSSPLYVSNNAKRILERAVWNDTTFLNSINVMDYSLLVGVDAERRELVCGIIDYLRQYTWDKQLETWVKSSLVPKNVLPTVISPKEYKRRFRKFMSKHFLSIPDHWCSPELSDPCHQCAVRGRFF